MEPSQEEIADKLEIREDELFDCDLITINKFLAEQGLESKFINPFTEPCFSPDIFLETTLTGKTDILAAYDYTRLHQTKLHQTRLHQTRLHQTRLHQTRRQPEKNFSLITKYNPRSENVHLHDPTQKRNQCTFAQEKYPLIIINLDDLINSMQPHEDPRYGFYVVSS